MYFLLASALSSATKVNRVSYGKITSLYAFTPYKAEANFREKFMI